MKLIQFFLFVVTIFLFASCEKHDHLHEGEIITKYRNIDTNYTQVYLVGAFDLFIVQDPSFRLKIEGGENLLSYIHTDVIGSKLIIEEENNDIHTEHTVRVYISKSFLRRIDVSGSAYVIGENLVANNFDIDIDGSADINLAIYVTDNMTINISGSGHIDLFGEAEVLDVHIDGSGNIDALDFPVFDAYITIDGSGDLYVNVSDLLDVVINGSGHVFYVGDPYTILTSISGAGTVEPF